MPERRREEDQNEAGMTARAPAEKDSGSSPFSPNPITTRPHPLTLLLVSPSLTQHTQLPTMSTTPPASSRRAAFGGQLTSSNPPSDSPAPAPAPVPSPDTLPDLGYSLTPGVTPPPGLDQSAPAGRAKGKARARPAANKKLSGLAAAPNPDAPTTGERDCFLCAEPATYWAVGECGHRTCDVCAVRMRALYKKTECSFCKVSKQSGGGGDPGPGALPTDKV